MSIIKTIHAEPIEQAHVSSLDEQSPTVRPSFSQQIRSTYIKMLSTSWLLSAMLHVVALLVIGKVFLPMLPPPPIQELVMGESIDVAESLVEFQELQIETDVALDSSADSAQMPVETEVTIAEPKLSSRTEVPKIAMAEPVMTMADSITDIAVPAIRPHASAVAARSSMKASELRQAGGNAGSEASVRESLVWLVKHQLPDGGWTLQHNRLVDGCDCGNFGFKEDSETHQPKLFEARLGATGLALLPFLGSGRTHMAGEYQQVVKAGLAFLVDSMDREGSRAALTDAGNFYSHGICTIAICEAYAITKDPTLAEPAQALINHIVYAQDPKGGGWRYVARQPGDTSVTGWQFMALKSAKMAGLHVPQAAIEGANLFLNAASIYDGAYAVSDGVIASVTPDTLAVNVPAVMSLDKKSVKSPPRQIKYTGLDTTNVKLKPGQALVRGAPIAPYNDNESEMNGWKYRYMVVPDLKPEESEIGPLHPTPTLTAVGMLCRMYYGWEQDNPLLKRSVDYLAERGPSTSESSKVAGPNMYYNYYATQVLRHRGSREQWAAWNEALRDFLIESQDVSGHQRGSWYFGDHAHGDTHGGRLYSTALASMILEVYYRHMPLYQSNVTESFLD